MSERASPALESLGPESGWRVMGWRERLTSRYVLGAGYAFAALMTTIAVWMASSAPVTGPVGPQTRTILIILCLNLVLIAALAILAAWRVFQLVAAPARGCT
jgi:two-component system nitrogen regulation sensor histidine kinase NtrY